MHVVKYLIMIETGQVVVEDMEDRAGGGGTI